MNVCRCIAASSCFYGFNISLWYSIVNPGVSHFAITPGGVFLQIGHGERLAAYRLAHGPVNLPPILDGLAQPR